MIITIFEDNNNSNLYPLNINRASFELRCGAFTNLERINNQLSPNDTIHLIVRSDIEPIIKEKYPYMIVNPDIVSNGLWLNGRSIWDKKINKIINSGKIYKKNDIIVALDSQIDVPFTDFYSHLDRISSIPVEIDIQIFNNIWDGIFIQSKILIKDSIHFMKNSEGVIHPTVSIENGDNIFIGSTSEVRAGSVLDASKGPIIIDNNSIVDIGSLVQGPIYIGERCIINPGSKLRGNISLGPGCKIGGEVEDVIFQGYSNKQHDGFLGHSYIGQWINLGANTNCSDLKNNYGKIKLKIKDDIISTGEQFLGTMMGDYSRTGISTMLNTGTIIGFGANIFGSGFQEKYIPSFQWGRDGKTELDKFLSTIEKMKLRRGKYISVEEKKLITKLFYEETENNK